MDSSMTSSTPISAYPLVNGIAQLAPIRGYPTTSLGLSRSWLPSFKVATRLNSPSNAENELRTPSLSPEASDEDEKTDDASVYHLEKMLKAVRYYPNAATPMISRYRPSAIPAGFDWGSDTSDISDDLDESDSNASEDSEIDNTNMSDESDSDEDKNEVTAVNANTPDGIKDYNPDAPEEYDGRGRPFIYTLTDRDLMISYGYRGGLHPFLHYDEHDNLVVDAVPLSSQFDQIDGEESEEASEEATSLGETANAQNVSRAPKSSAIAPLEIHSLAVTTSDITSPAVRPATTKVTTSKRKVAAKPRQKAQKDVFRAARTWVSKSNKTEMRQLLAEWFGEGYNDAENANDLGVRLAALQKAYIEIPDNKEEDNTLNEIVGKGFEIGYETKIDNEVLDVQTLQSSVTISGKSTNATNATTATEVTKAEEEVPAKSPGLQVAYIKLLSDRPENKDTSKVADEELEADHKVEDGAEIFEEELYLTVEDVSVNFMNANQDTDRTEADDDDVSAKQSASLIGKKRQRGDSEDQDKNSSEEHTSKKAKIVEPYENVKQLDRPIKKTKKRAQV
jgi:hypothetical protein